MLDPPRPHPPPLQPLASSQPLTRPHRVPGILGAQGHCWMFGQGADLPRACFLFISESIHFGSRAKKDFRGFWSLTPSF